MHVPLAHVEAGIRSGDKSMPEEINRIVTDSICDYFFTTSRLAGENLKRSGVEDDKIAFVGNTMIDTLRKHQKFFNKPTLPSLRHLKKNEYLVLTLHRPNNVDDQNLFTSYLHEILKHSGDLPVVFPTHPRTKQMMDQLDLNYDRLIISKPLGYKEFNYLVANSLGVITDSGGITEETTVMGIPCMTLRNSTERPETVNIGTNELLGTDPKKIKPALEKLFSGNWKKGSIPERWDGKAAERIIRYLIDKHGR